MLLKFFNNWSGGFGVISIFHFLDYLEDPLRYVSVPENKKVFTHVKKTFDKGFPPPPFLTTKG